jgi:hypothetical protein|tara:strand:- start:50 stop:232 length:183 start_codon:yes stop_codon:yes gene_type:complete
MNKRELKKKLKSYLARRIWYDDEMQENFLVLSGLLPQTESAEARFQKVILELREEWINDV